MGRREIEKAIVDAIQESAARGKLRDELHDVVDRVEDAWHMAWEASGPHPYEDDSYKRAIQSRKEAVIRLKRRGWTKVGEAFNDDPNAEYVEYGTGDTPEFAPARRAHSIVENS